MESLKSEMSAGVSRSDVEMMWNATTSAQENADMAPAVAAMNVLADWIKKSKATTMMELQIQLKTAAEHIESFAPDVIAITAGCELFIRYVTRSNTEIPNFQECRAALVDRSAYYKEMTLKSRNRIAELGETFIRDGSVVLLHGNSRVVLRVLQAAGESGKRFSVMVTEGQPDGHGLMAAKTLMEMGFAVTIVPDSTVGYIMEKVDYVLVGAEAVVENGGIINKVGTNTIAIVAKAANKPVYVAAESYKFARMYPLRQDDVPNPDMAEKLSCDPEALSKLRKEEQTLPGELKLVTPTRDFTPPQFLTLLFTDLGVLTPSAVSDELIKLYY